MRADHQFEDWYIVDLIAWALVERDGHQLITGIFAFAAEIGGELGLCVDDEYFVGYLSENDMPPGDDEMQRRIDVAKEVFSDKAE